MRVRVSVRVRVEAGWHHVPGSRASRRGGQSADATNTDRVAGHPQFPHPRFRGTI